MMKSIKSVEQILPSIRALLAKELVSKHGYSKKKVSEVMGITPSAVTQYSKRRRGLQGDVLISRREIRLLVSDLATSIAGQRGMKLENVSNRIIDLSYQVLAILKGSAPAMERSKETSTGDKSTLNLLRLRLETELREAQRSLEVANSLEDSFAKMLFREIATDSMRHADIVTHLIESLDSVKSLRVDSSMRAHLDQMMIEEDQAADQHLSKLVRVKHPAVKALLRSVDADEDKHRKMLRILSTGLRE